MRKIGLNTDENSCCRCIKANYYKAGGANFLRWWAGARDGFVVTAVLEIYDEKDSAIECHG